MMPGGRFCFAGSALFLGLALEERPDQPCPVWVIRVEVDMGTELQLLKMTIAIVARVDELLAVPANVPFLDHGIRHAAVV